MNPLNYAKIDIALVNAVAYQRACQLPGSQSFSITLSNGETSARSASASAEKPIDLTGIPEEYHDFADVFSKVKANKLPPHRPHNLKINIEEGSTPPLSPIYSLSKTELEWLREFLDENCKDLWHYKCPYWDVAEDKPHCLYLCRVEKTLHIT